MAAALMRDDPAAAARALDESIALGRRGTSGGLLGYALSHRALLRSDANDLDGARRDVQDAVRHSHDRGDRPMLTTALECAVAVLQRLGRDEASAMVAGALGAGVTSGVARSLAGGMVADLGVVDALARAQAELGDAQYAAARRRGAEMGLDEAVDYVLKVLDVAEPAIR
jgi:hypothetical protein